MSLADLRTLATSKVARQILLGRKHSPKILFVAGTVGVIGTVVMACRATLKVADVLDNHEKKTKELLNTTKYDFDGDQAKDLNKLKVKTAIDIAKLYALPVGLGVASIGALTGSHFVLSKRNTAVMAAYATVDRAYKEYRSRVVGEYGTEVDRKFATGGETVLVEEKLADGTTKTTTKTKKPENGKFGGSPYAVVFDERSKHFSKEPGRNAEILMMKQHYANQALQARGHFFLNELYDMLDLPRTPEGAHVGWIYNSKDPNYEGDNYVDFNLFDVNDNDLVEGFIDGDYRWVTIDPNVDGVIWNLI